MTHLRTSTIIHGFALLHAATAVVCRVAGVDDELVLTTLTIALSLIICLRYRQSFEFSAIVLIIVNILGYGLGNGIAPLIGLLMHHPLLSHAIASFATTELMGWGLVLFMNRFGQRNASGTNDNKAELRWLLVAVVAILVARVFITLFSSSLFGRDSLLLALSDFLGNSLVLLIMVCLTIMHLEYEKRLRRKGLRKRKLLLVSLFIIATTLVSAGIVGLGIPYKASVALSWGRFGELALIALIVEVLVYSILYMIEYAISARRNAQLEKDRADLAKFQYLNLKQQLNPHFLFNSLNILDALVLDGKDEEASTYIHKLAGIYRYMLKNEDEILVSMRDEMTYVGMYTDLLKVRFQKGFIVNIDIPESALGRSVVPCAVQLLIENATKHNAVLPEKPLVVDVVSDGETLTVTNNLIPRMTRSQSSGLGLHYIRQQYEARPGKGIRVQETENVYTVTIPLL